MPDLPASAEQTQYFKRFGAFDRILHGLLMIAFLGLAATGLPLLFNDTAWARRITHFLGSFEVAGWLHRVCALLLISVFAIHIGRIVRRVFGQKDWGVLWGPRSMVPRMKDLTDMTQHLKWFLRLGPKPHFDRFTYWEKFDYWAVFWGMAIIGFSGLLLWFPVFFARFVPGWIFNIAMLVHGEEALLAVGFIFTIHFFNSHLRPEKFPIDRVIFTGRITEEELKEERPEEYARLVRTGKLDEWKTDPPPWWLVRASTIIAAVVVSIGLLLVSLIILAVLRS